jgi:hypothetical protein
MTRIAALITTLAIAAGAALVPAATAAADGWRDDCGYNYRPRHRHVDYYHYNYRPRYDYRCSPRYYAPPPRYYCPPPRYYHYDPGCSYGFSIHF